MLADDEARLGLFASRQFKTALLCDTLEEVASLAAQFNSMYVH